MCIRDRDQDGRLVTGTNNLNAVTPQKLYFKKNESKTLHFDSTNIFGNQKYTVDASVVSADSTIVFDSWDEAAQFTSVKSYVYYPIVCPARLTVSE